MTLKGLDFDKELLLKTPSDRRRKGPSLLDYAPELRGPSNNRYCGHQALRLRGFRGGTYGPAGLVKKYTPEEIQDYEREFNQGSKDLKRQER
jgi:hypothetical protein